ncbi:hypothetical protein [Anaeromicrobium sediminis]|uniref:Uncharacterized protein n=1 Tax=Anaeromicrobium sediminis TaxID=1478221 RepID=A0A267MN96_9FIRM|nr:hypothetical protein [Anaeromicrobium sediminis]PAB61006.1 hypothetical protein CCE28_00820 [Anaeromicrobium sediminis]
MSLFIELKPEDRRNSEKCKAAIANIEKVFKEKRSHNEKITCAICNKLLSNRFRSACRVMANSKTVLVHPVHIGCIKENSPMNELFGNKKEYVDMSTIDLITMINIIDTLHKLDKEDKLPELNNDILSSNLHMPNPEIKGQPFYTMVEIKNGVLTGNIESYNHKGKYLPMLYVSKRVAERAKKIKDNAFKNNYYVAGISEEGLNDLFSRYSEESIVVLGFEGEKGVSMPLTSKEILNGLKPNKWLSKIIMEQQ